MDEADLASVAFGLGWAGGFFPYQRDGIDRLLSSDSLLLADEMGLGKTVQAVAAIRILTARKQIARTLVVVPVGLVLQWRRQFRHWAPELRLSTIAGAAHERRRAWEAPADVYVAGYEAIRADFFVRARHGPRQVVWDVVVIDEAQRIKNADVALSGTIKRLTRNRSWALTGTPLENRLDDLISVLDFVAPGRFQPGSMAVGLRRLLGEVQLRRRRADVLPDLPPKLVSIVGLPLSPPQRASYRRAEEEGRVRIAALGRDVTILHVLELILRLKQICNADPETGRSSKLDDLRERLERVFGAGEKALVFSQFISEPFGARRLARDLAAYEPILLTGDQPPASRASAVAAFNGDPRRRLMILSLKAGGVGLNLTSASHVFHYDRWWNPATEVQAEDRVHRIGQSRPVNVYAYLCEDTIEQRIDEIISEKRALFAEVIDGADLRDLARFDLDTLLRAVGPPSSPPGRPA